MMGETWLMIGAHPDDVELGCGGTLAKYSQEKIVYYLVVSPAIEDPRNKNILNEFSEACQVLNIPLKKRIIMEYERRTLPNYRNQIRQDLIELVNDITPDVIFSPDPNDLHQDHAIIGQEILRLFRTVNIVGYEVISSSLDFIPNFYVTLINEQMTRKIEALQRYSSQLSRPYFKPEIIMSLARMRGAQIRTPYAEAFKILRMVEH